MKTASNIIDVPLPEGASDLLGITPYINSLNKFIMNAQLPTTLAIQGEWGSGKTSLMNQIRYALCSQKNEQSNFLDDKPFYGIWLNTWQYSLMKSADETLLAIIQAVTHEVLSLISANHPKKMEAAISQVGNLLGKLARVSAKAAVGIAGLKGEVVDNILSSENESAQANPMEFRNALALAIQKCLEEDANKGKKTKGFLFFIDDLDRLDPPVAVQILEILKNLFEVKNCIFILAIDYDVVVKGLTPKFGPLTESNEREFRSFFDKIIQLPFTMPVNAYRVDVYIEEALENIDFYTKEECRTQVSGQNRELSKILAEMIELSTGTNPRSIKRLINTLSLVLIMSAENINMNDRLSINERLLIFGLICLQIAYPTIYNLLLFDPDFKTWDENMATQFRFAALDEFALNSISKKEEFDEVWEQILYRACQQNSYLASRAIFVSRLLSLIAATIPKDKSPEAEIEKMLNFSSITSINSSEALQGVEQKHMRRVQLQGPEQLFEELEAKGAGESVAIAKDILQKLLSFYGDFITMEVTPKIIILNVKNKKNNISRLIQIQPKQKDVSLRCPAINNDSWIPVRTLESGERFSLPTDFYDVIKNHFNDISTDTL